MNKILFLPLFVFAWIVQSCQSPERMEVDKGPLRVSTENSRYFTDNHGKAIYLTGAHTWNNLVDMVNEDSIRLFDYTAYLAWMKDHHYNFFRMWTWELLNWNTRGNRETNAQILKVFPHPWARTGPGKALDGELKFNLEQYDEQYFNRLKDRVQMAGNFGIYVSVMLFEGWGLQFSPDAFAHHPFHPENNVNGINGDLDGDGTGIEIHTLGDPEILAIQEAYVKKVLETVNNSDYVLFEIANECQPSSTEWQYHMINLIKEYEKDLPKQHPVGMTFQYRGGSNETLFNSPADWISPNPENGYRDDPPASVGSKVVITDTDHLWGIGGNAVWVWKSFLRGLNPIFMDPYDRSVLTGSYDTSWVDPLRTSLGYSRILADSIDLTGMTPDSVRTSSGYCLMEEGESYLVFVPDTISVSVDLGGIGGTFESGWFDPASGTYSVPDLEEGGLVLNLTSPFKTENNILYLKKVED
jgi:hypothetical protein